MSVMNLEECELLADSKYRAYISQVEKALKAFEYTSEWADLISALGKLNKVLATHVKYPVIPKRVTIGKRLAQCLHPALPNGVHIKALETYDIIFKCIGTPRLAADLFTYGAGLFPCLAYAAMNVRPALLSLYENHFVPLGKNIKPALTGVILGILPGLEEGSEHFDRTTHLLQDFCDSAEALFFYGCLWECVLSCPSVRLAAINFVLGQYNRKQSMEDQLYFMGTSIDLLVECLCSSVQDSSVLVQRSALELLLIGFPMHNSQLTRPDMIKIISAAINVVLRRDMSLNRRLYAWVLGTDSNGNPITVPSHPDTAPARREALDSVSTSSEVDDMDYFNTYSKDLLIVAVKSSIREGSNTDPGLETKMANLKPFRILISLLDKPEIGSAILEDILIEVFRCMYRECQLVMVTSASSSQGDPQENLYRSAGISSNPAKNLKRREVKTKKEEKTIMSEIVKTANLLFGIFEPFYIWDFLGRTFEKMCDACATHSVGVPGTEDLSISELCELVDFLLDKVSLETYTEIQTEHLPELLRHITMCLCSHCESLTDTELTSCLHLCSKVLGKVVPAVIPIGWSDGDSVSMHSSPFKRHGAPPADDDETPGVFSESDVFLSADSDTGEVVHGSASEDATQDRERTPKQKKGSVASTVGTSKDTPKDDTKVDMDTISFSDFVQYEGTENVEVPQFKISPRKAFRRQASSERLPQNLMQSCVASFQKLFAKLVISRILQDPEIPQVLLKQLMFPANGSAEVNMKPLQLFRINSGGDISFSWKTEDDSVDFGSKEARKLKVEGLSRDLSEAFGLACHLLVDFSSFPMFCTDYHKVMSSSFRPGQGLDFPLWLQLLLTCACFIDNFPIQSAAVSTMLDLISLTLSVNELSDSKVKQGHGIIDEEQRRSTTEGTVSVVIVPSLSPQNLRYLNDKTCFYKIVASSLWTYLDECSPQCHSRSVELLFQLHQLAPVSWICEDVIGNSLLSDDKARRISSYKRFAILWHLLRERIPSSNAGKPLRTFDRSMFVVLDSLQNDTHPCSALTHTWLTHTVQRGDITRILEPLMMILLHPDTSRISIQHVNIHRPKRIHLSSDGLDDQSDAAETKIYAISSEGGNVIYHVSNQGNNKPVSQKTTEELRNFALTSITEDGSATKMAQDKNVETELHFEKVDPTDLNLRVNPFGSEGSQDRVVVDGFNYHMSQFPNLDNIRRLNTETCKKEGIFFEENENSDQEDDEDVASSANHSKDGGSVTGAKDDQSSDKTQETDVPVMEGTPEEMIKSILEELVDTATGTEQESVSKPPEDQDQVRPRLCSSRSHDGAGGSFSDDLFHILSSKISEDSLSETDVDTIGGVEGPHKQEEPIVHPLHTHLLLYSQKYDAQRTLYALSCLKNILSASPRLVTCSLSTTSLSSSNMPHATQLLDLLMRHRRSMFGKNFFHEVPPDTPSALRNSMFVEILLSVCLYFMRSYYPNLMMSKLTEQELNGNKEVQILSCEILTLLLSELVNIAKDSGKGFATYISDLLGRCKVQKALLHCILSSVYNARRRMLNEDDPTNITEAIISFNEENMDANTNETFQIKLLKLLLIIIILEDQICKSKLDTETMAALPPEWEKAKLNFQPMLTVVRYVNSRPLVYQGMLLSAILSALRQQHLSNMHRHWIAMVTSCMPYMGRALSHTIVTVVNQICRNVELLAQQYELGNLYMGAPYQPDKVPPDHVTILLEALTTMCHYCLLDNAPQSFSIGQALPTSANDIMNENAPPGQIFSNLMSVFASSREPSPAKEPSTMVNPVLEARRHLLSILPRILASLAILWKAVLVSEDLHSSTGRDQACWTMGLPKTIKQYILEFLSPISVHHGVNLLGAMGVVWNDRRQRGAANTKRPLTPTRDQQHLLSCMEHVEALADVWRSEQLMLGKSLPPSRLRLVIPHACDDQLLLVDLVSAVKVLPTDTLIQTVKQVIKTPPPTTQDKNKKRTPLEVSMLQFFYAYVQRTPGAQLVDSWPSLLSLLKEGLQLNLTPPGQFLLLAVLNEFVQKIPMFEERKDQKELQEISQKLLEACSEIAGASLEQTTFFRRNLAVKPGPQVDVTVEVDDTTTDQEAEDVPPPVPIAMETRQLPAMNNYRQYSVQGLVMLAELTATLLDVVYRSEEKDRVVPLLNTILHNVFPYLKNHSDHNLPSYRACSQMLASLSSYQYTRKAWKKEAFDLLMDASYFQMDQICITYWRVIIDNLMTHDKTTFRDLLIRVPVAQSAALNLFSSRDAEFEQRAQLLKRLSFVVFCSEVDQYQRSMPDVQERLADSLRVPSVPSVQAQVFVFFRVLMLRISPQHLTSLWPTIITELVHVLLQIEQELSPDVEESRNKRAQQMRNSNVDPSWSLGNGLNTHNHPSWLRLYLSACKLLDLALVLPADILPQFQLYRWAFVGETGTTGEQDRRRHKDIHPSFVPHVIRIAKLMAARFGEGVILPRQPGRPLLGMTYIRSLKDLQSFFNTIAVSVHLGEAWMATRDHDPNSLPANNNCLVSKSKSAPEFRNLDELESNSSSNGSTPPTAKTAIQEIELMLEMDFLELLPKK